VIDHKLPLYLDSFSDLLDI